MIPTLENFKKYLEKEIDLVEFELIHGLKIDNMENYAEYRGKYKILLKIKKDLLGEKEVSLI
ncbi:MAG: hypothetical protein ACE5SV_08110 [Candidatus Nitrosomaritimum aestuariumsis]|jgi:hypothetical protein